MGRRNWTIGVAAALLFAAVVVVALSMIYLDSSDEESVTDRVEACFHGTRASQGLKIVIIS